MISTYAGHLFVSYVIAAKTHYIYVIYQCVSRRLVLSNKSIIIFNNWRMRINLINMIYTIVIYSNIIIIGISTFTNWLQTASLKTDIPPVTTSLWRFNTCFKSIFYIIYITVLQIINYFRKMFKYNVLNLFTCNNKIIIIIILS